LKTPAPDHQTTIALAEKLGVAIKILSGDSKEVTEYVAREVAWWATNKLSIRRRTGWDVRRGIQPGCQENNVFARLNPEHKYRIIKLLKQNNVVGYQGDGINDAPALKLADVAIAVNSATDVAQDSADILLLRMI